MSAYKDPRDGTTWRYRKTVRLPDGSTTRISGKPSVNTKKAAEDAERAHVERVLAEFHVEKYAPGTLTKSVPTFRAWFRGTATGEEEFNGPFWMEWVVARKNKPTECRSKRTVYELHLEPVFGDKPLNKIGVAEVARFRADLVLKKLSDKTINKILCVLSKPLRYAEDCGIIARAPKMGLAKVERPEIVWWEYEEYARLLAAAKAHADQYGDAWYAAVCLAGEAGLRVGEVKALRWREDIDMTARTITVNQQTCEGITTTPKGRTRRAIPMTSTLYDALKRMSTVREGLVLKGNGPDGGKPDGEVDHEIARICRRAGLPVRYWHTLRHTFGTHAALLGVNPWRLQAWLGHKRIDETMLYVHVGEDHARELPEVIAKAALGELHPDARVIAQLGERAAVPCGDIGPAVPRRRAPCQRPANEAQPVV